MMGVRLTPKGFQPAKKTSASEETIRVSLLGEERKIILTHYRSGESKLHI
jgi:hypothetical protein